MFKLWPARQQASKSPASKITPRNGTASPSTLEADEQEASREALAKILRILGRHAFDLDQHNAEAIAKDFEEWARHVLIGVPTDTPETATEPSRGVRRQWADLCRFVNRHRQGEKAYVHQNIQNLRDFIWTFIQHVGEAVVQDQDTDTHILEHLHQLKQATEGRSLEQMKQEVLSAVNGLQQVMSDRAERQKRHMQTLGEKIQAVEKELGSAKKQMALDPLTQLFNRASLDEHIQRVMALNLVAGTPACFLMIDIDHFKSVNDTYGHQAGDEVIRQVANQTVLTFPRKTDFVARYGGEEFAVILQSEPVDTGRLMAERLLDAIRHTPVSFQEKEIPITASVGLAAFLPGETAAQWIARADKALYRAKEQGRDQLAIAEEEEPSTPLPTNMERTA